MQSLQALKGTENRQDSCKDRCKDGRRDSSGAETVQRLCGCNSVCVAAMRMESSLCGSDAEGMVADSVSR
eukprot:3518459-Rhodomonas_salina.1